MPKHIHIHLEPAAALEEILDRLTNLELLMSDISNAQAAQAEAWTGLVARVQEDFANLQSVAEAALAAAETSASGDAADAATIADLRAQLEGAVASINETTEKMNAVDPDASYPQSTQPVEAEVPEETPTPQA